ncbi:hypothetical protein [Liquorilactobacillus uvarum]|uniref:hypothetical protein n=1 Tax=Liquorilactobacillus uvarum TaxID=303240 RepID=UPI00288A39E2|nr:hypothetical protein [Liquorilactobacillus uvarum]
MKSIKFLTMKIKLQSSELINYQPKKIIKKMFKRISYFISRKWFSSRCGQFFVKWKRDSKVAKHKSTENFDDFLKELFGSKK